MNKVLHIALNTFRESARDRVLYVILLLAGLLMLVGRGLGWVSVGEQIQIVKHFSLAVTSLFGALIAVFVGTGLIYKEIDKRTVYTILSKPVERWQFIVGKYLGLLVVLSLVVVGVGAAAAGFVALVGGQVDRLFILAVVLILGELAVVTALAVFFSTISSPILAAIFTFSAYLVGQVTPSLMALVNFEPVATPVAAATGEQLTDFVSQHHWLLKPVSQAFYLLLPNLTHFQLRNRVVYGPPLEPGEFLNAALYAAGYSAAVLLVAVLCFDRKKF